MRVEGIIHHPLRLEGSISLTLVGIIIIIYDYDLYRISGSWLFDVSRTHDDGLHTLN